MRFTDRVEAGRQLAAKLEPHRRWQPVVAGLPRGGIPVARAVAEALDAPLDVIMVRKLGLPGSPEIGMGAIAEGGIVVFNQDVIRGANVSDVEVRSAMDRELQVLRRRMTRVHEHHSSVSLRNRTVIVVDDGLATGISARAACRAARHRGATQIVLAVPVAPSDWRDRLEGEADVFVAAFESEDFQSVAQFYDQFEQVSDEELLRCLI